ncbi:hypothetical protein GCM10022381_29880 [Leifsonia kafniensis]|uniref:Histidinol dehydrogenase n=1 Tax=Leifsonia kafniensis TaxID=475957 RepID=A0ABP7KRQ7_9MICO
MGEQLFGEVGIDLSAGPTEVLIIADHKADPFIVAVDLLSQAEHGPDSPAVLITTSNELAHAVLGHIERILPDMPTRDFAEPAWRNFGEIHVVEAHAFVLADEYVFEHVQILTENPREALETMHHHGALFLGEGTCVSYGDKTIGTNHVLPTRGAARYTGGLWVGKYLRTVTYQEVTNTESSAMLGEVIGRAASKGTPAPVMSAWPSTAVPDSTGSPPPSDHSVNKRQSASVANVGLQRPDALCPRQKGPHYQLSTRRPQCARHRRRPRSRSRHR